MARYLEDKVAVVTGAGRGVGEAYARALAAQGAAVVVNDMALSAAEAVAERIRASGGRAAANGEDISVYDRAGDLIDAAVGAFGKVDILVANAGILRAGWLHEMSEKDFTETFAVHVNGTFNCYRHAAPLMIRHGGGTIITTGAGAGEGAPERVGMGRAAHPGLVAYRAAKAAIGVMTLHAAGELEPHGINVNTIMPGATATPMQQGFYRSLTERGVAAEPLEAGWPMAAPPETVPPLGVFLCTEVGRRVTGRAFQLNGSELRVATAPTSMSSLRPVGTSWTLEELLKTAPAWLGL